MAISKNLYTRGLKQRLAGAVWYNRKGETVVRELAAQVSNPKSTAQMEQRAKLANLVAFYRANQFWMHWGSFQTKKQEWSDYNAFVSANMGMDAVYLTKQWAEAGATVVAPYIVSVGSLPRINVVASSDVLITDLYVGNISITTDTTIGTISAALLANNNALREGDQLSIVVEVQQSTIDAPYITARAYELIIDTTDTLTVAARGLAGLLTVDGGAGYEALSVQLPSENGGGTVILSREDSTGLKVSSQSIIVTETQDAYLASFKTAQAKAAYLRSYGSDGTENFLSGGYSSGASEGVSLPQQILRVNSAAAGQYWGRIEANQNFVVYFAQPIADSAVITASIGSEDSTAHNQPVTVTRRTSDTELLLVYSESAIVNNVLRNVDVVIDGVEYLIEFAATSGGEITE